MQVLETNNYVTADGTVHHNSGKTWVGCASICKHVWEWPRINSGYFAPTYAQIRDIFYPTIDEVAHDWGLRVVTKVSDKEVDFYSGQRYRSTTICRSMEKPQTIVGFKIGHALVDELDVMPEAKAKHAWRKIIARMRYNVDGLKNGVDVTTTPEGFKFVYHQFVKQLREKPSLAGMYGLVQASTYDNEANLPDDYIPSLRESYPPQLIEAYLNGQFVNLTSGTIYHAYSRAGNASSETVQPSEALHIGMDFNVGKMAAVTHVLRKNDPHAVDEITGGYDTPDMIRQIKERYWDYRNGTYQKTREIRVYPDASGGSRKSVNASATDIALLKQAGFIVVAPEANPPVKDRINAMNAMFCNATGERRYRVNAAKCPSYADALEQQIWAPNGEPDKTQGVDHLCFTGSTLVQTKAGTFRFDNIPASGFVIGPDGDFTPYSHARKTGKKQTVRVTFADGYFIDCTDDHQFLTEDGSWVQAKNLRGCVCVSSVRQRKSSMAFDIIFAGSTSPTPQCQNDGSIALFGSSTMARSQMGIMSTTLTETAPTTKSKISNAFRRASTSRITGLIGVKQFAKWAKNTSILQKIGTSQRLVGLGTSHIIKRFEMRSAQRLRKNALAVESSSMPRSASSQVLSGIAQRHVRHMHAGRAELTTLLASAFRAPHGSMPTSIVLASPVMSVSPLGEQDVYCLTAPETGCFKLTKNGPIVSNCDAGGYFIHKQFPIVKPSYGTMQIRGL